MIKSWQIIMKAFAVVSLVLTLSFVGCTKFAVDEDETISIFDEKASQILSSSLVELPESLVVKTDETTDMSMENIDFEFKSELTNYLNIDGMHFHNDESPYYQHSEESQGEDYGALYDIVRNYAGVAAEVRSKIDMFINNLIPGLHVLKDVELPVVLPDYLVGKFGLHKIVIGIPKTAEYTWEVDLYYSAESSEPEVAFFLSLNESGGKGRMFMKMENEEDTYASNVNIPGVKLTRKIEAVFDGTQNPKKFEIKYIGDRSEARDYAEKNWSDLSSEQKDALTKIPDKIFLTIKHNNENREFDVYGASYHPGWGLLEDLEGQAFLNSRSRTIYTFKGRSSDSNESGGIKLLLGLPSEDIDFADVWEEYSVGAVFTDVVRERVSATIARLNDDINDYAPACASDPNWGSAEVCRDDEDTPQLYEGDEFVERYKATAMYACIMGDCMLDDEIEDRIPENPNAFITQDNLEKFVYHPSVGLADVEDTLFEKVADLYTQCRVIAYMKSPAFFRDGKGFVGTYNEERQKFYSYTYDNGAFGDGTVLSDSDSENSVIGNLLNISLDDVESYVPSAVKIADITR